MELWAEIHEQKQITQSVCLINSGKILKTQLFNLIITYFVPILWPFSAVSKLFLESKVVCALSLNFPAQNFVIYCCPFTFCEIKIQMSQWLPVSKSCTFQFWMFTMTAWIWTKIKIEPSSLGSTCCCKPWSLSPVRAFPLLHRAATVLCVRRICLQETVAKSGHMQG